jgi:hypothetical protein
MQLYDQHLAAGNILVPYEIMSNLQYRKRFFNVLGVLCSLSKVRAAMPRQRS